MDFEKLADKFIEEGGWQGSPRIAIELFAKWLAEQEAAQQSVQLTGAMVSPIERDWSGEEEDKAWAHLQKPPRN